MKEQVVRIEAEAQVVWKATRTPNGNWVGICEPLGITAEADTQGDLLKTIAESMDLLFAELFETGDLDQFLKDRGWHAMESVTRTGTKPRFDFPIDLKTEHHGRLEAARY